MIYGDTVTFEELCEELTKLNVTINEVNRH